MDEQQTPHGEFTPEAPPPDTWTAHTEEGAPGQPQALDAVDAVDSAPSLDSYSSYSAQATPPPRSSPLPIADVSAERARPDTPSRFRSPRSRQTVDLAHIARLAREQFSREQFSREQLARDLGDLRAQVSRDLGDLRERVDTLRSTALPSLRERVSELHERAGSTLAEWRSALGERAFPPANADRPPSRRAPRQVTRPLLPPPSRPSPRSTTHSTTRPLLPPLPKWRAEQPESRAPRVMPLPWPLRPVAPIAPPRLMRRVRAVARISPNATRRLRDPRKRLLLTSSLVVLASMVISLLIPGLAAASAMKDYGDLKALGEQAIHHLLAAKDDLSALTTLAGKSAGTSTATSLGACSTTSAPATPTASPTAAGSTGAASSTDSNSSAGASGKLSAALDPQAFKAAQSELQAADGNFQLLRTRLKRPDWVVSTAASLPGLESKLRSIAALADVGDDISTLGVEVIAAALPVVTRLHGASSLAGDTELLTQDDLNHIQAAAADAQDKLTDIQAKLSDVNLADLPLCAKQKDEITQVESALPQIRASLAQGTQLLGAAGWLLGVDHPRAFLVQTLDRAELRPSGGFTGNYGVLTLQNGKVDPFTLYNVNDIDYGLRTNGWIFGQRPPDQYSWWPFGNWGLRDANLSADYPMTAKLIEQVFANEGGGSVDGVIQVSPTAIAHVLLVTGPIYVPIFNDTITAANLEDKIHFYEEDPAGIAIQQKLFPDDHTHSLRKRFTQKVVQLLQAKVKSLPPSQLFGVAKQLVKDLQAKDVQVYVNNPQLEDLLTQLQASGSVDTTPGIDGYFLAQANVSVAKLSPYIQVTQSDNVTLDNNGGAAHHLVMTFFNNPTGPIYGFSTYRDYLRVYVPPQAQLKRANGFDTGVPLCWAPSPGYSVKPGQFADVPTCGANPYPSRALVCPPGAYGPGPGSYTVFGGDSSLPAVLDHAGGPTNTATDIPGRAMWGGYIVIPQFCTATLTLDYYVPGIAAPASAVPGMASPYTMLMQRQGGTFYTVNVTIHPSPSMAASNMKTTQYSAQLGDNTAFTLGKPDPQSGAQFFGLGPYGSLLGLDKG